jgi:DNA-binding IclR family transcriptional regulator
MQNPKQTTMKSLTKAMDILQLFADCRRDMALKEIASRSGLNKTTVNRILATLVSRGFIKQRVKRGNYSLGPIYLEFSGIVKSEIQLRKIAISYLNKLAADIHESVLIAYGNGKSSDLFTETFHDSSQQSMLKVIPEEGTSLPLHATFAGKILLADMNEKELVAYFKGPIKTYTPNTITDLKIMKSHLKTVAADDVAVDEEEYTIGVRGIGTSIRDSEGKIAGAIGVLVPTARLSKSKLKELFPEIKSCARAISKELGFNE